MDDRQPSFLKPTRIEQALNGLMGALVGWGVGPSYSYLLEVTGRKTGRVYSTPVNLLEYNGKRYLVAPRGETQWVRNARAQGSVSLKRGRSRLQYQIRTVDDPQKPVLLKEYLERYKAAVQRYFPVRAGSTVDAFSAIASRYPVFELLPE